MPTMEESNGYLDRRTIHHSVPVGVVLRQFDLFREGSED